MILILNILNKIKSKISKRGFTLIELLVVIAIIGILSTIGVISLNTVKEKASKVAMLQQMKNLIPLIETRMFSGEAIVPGPGSWMQIDDPLKEICDGEYFPEPIGGWVWGNFHINSYQNPLYYFFSATKGSKQTTCTHWGEDFWCRTSD